MNNQSLPTSTTAVRQEASGLTKTFAVLAVILALSAFMLPIVGVLFIAPLAVICACIALYGRDFNSLGLVSAIMTIVNYIISPTFWANIGTGAQQGGGNLFLTWFGLLGSIVMIGLIVRKYARD
jgi:hypothetical protein